MSGGMRFEKFRAVLDDLGFIVVRDTGTRGGRFVRRSDMSPVGFYELYEDGAYRHGWVELPRSAGRTDCNSWPEFYQKLAEATKR